MMSTMEGVRTVKILSITEPQTSSRNFPAPEKKLTLFALRLALLEKTSTRLGTLSFIWATVVLLGGFAITLDKTDFWLITIILLIEGARIFGRSHELKWQQQATWCLPFITPILSAFRRKIRHLSHHKHEEKQGEDVKKRSRQCLRTRRWELSKVPFLPYPSWIFLSRNISKIFHLIQILAAVACAVLSSVKLIYHNYGEVHKGDNDKRNRESALNIFYSLALAEASFFLLEQIYWEFKVSYRKVLEKVNEECELGESGMISIERFFYDAYSKCVDNGIFDGLKMDMVSFALDLLSSSSPDEQLMGARILHQFAKNENFSNDTLQKIGENFSAVERLVEMLNWKDPQEEEIRYSAGEILSKFADKKQNSPRIAEIPGAMESIACLLHAKKTLISAANQDRIFIHQGLVILEKLARDHANCGKIGNTKGLLSKIIGFTNAEEILVKNSNVATCEIETVEKSMQVIRMLASTTGVTGKQLRKEISENVFTIRNIRDMLRHGEKHENLQKLGIEILTSLAIEDDAKERIGGTGGILRDLLNIFIRDRMLRDRGQETDLRAAAGEAVAMLALDCKQNCGRILNLGVLEKLVNALEIPLLRGKAAWILLNLCTYTARDCFTELVGVAAAIPLVLKDIVSEEIELQEVMTGLAARVFEIMEFQEWSIKFERAGITETNVVTALVQILKKHQQPVVGFPRIRRFTLELAVWMMQYQKRNIRTFMDLELEKELVNVLETTSELENFKMLSGTLGLSRYSTSMECLVEKAIHLLHDKSLL